MKKISLVIGGLLFLMGCSQTTSQTKTNSTESSTTSTTTTTSTQTTTVKKESSESSTVNDNLDIFKFNDKSFEIRASRRWLKEEDTNGAALALVGYRSRANVFFNIEKTTETTLENVATNSFKAYQTKHGIPSTLPQIPMKNASHPTIKTIYEIKKDTEKQVFVLYTIDMNGTFITVTCVISQDIFEDIREELDSIVNSLMIVK